MIYIMLEGHDFYYGIEHITKEFFPNESVKRIENKPLDDSNGVFICSSLITKEKRLSLSTHLISNGVRTYANEIFFDENISEYDYKKVVGKNASREVYIALVAFTKMAQPWGMLTGIRPAKIVHDMLRENQSREEIFSRLMGYFMISKDKAELLYDVAISEKNVLDKTEPNMIGLYIGIPFCTSRCLYCSFTSDTIYKNKNTVDEYIEALKKEIKQTSKIIKDKGYKIQSIYIGGGTPTAIEPRFLEQLLSCIEESYDIHSILEYTLEAGRPDSIDMERLRIIKESRVDRISINPQTMNDETLQVIGRNHTAKDVFDAFYLAREVGLNNINMDVIIGLPGEKINMFENTLKNIDFLSPESLTVHTMAIKRASRLNTKKDNYSFISHNDATQMIKMASDYAIKMNMKPYYMYRQKNMVGNLENIGYSKNGFESVYNVQIMEERQSILALGAGGISKVVFPMENRIERAFNVKNVAEYISRVDEMVERKRKLIFDS